jgi:Cytochrome P460
MLLMAAADETGGPDYTSDGALIMPADYREWVFLSAGLDMSYSDAPAIAGHSMFDNVFVDRASWQRFKATGHWPDRTMLVLEQRGATTRGSINKRGKYQTDERMAVEIHVRDESRFKGGWAFFVIDGDSRGQQVPYAAACYSCHLQHGAVDTTFAQFYPTAKAIAKEAGTFHGP